MVSRRYTTSRFSSSAQSLLCEFPDIGLRADSRSSLWQRQFTQSVCAGGTSASAEFSPSRCRRIRPHSHPGSCAIPESKACASGILVDAGVGDAGDVAPAHLELHRFGRQPSLGASSSASMVISPSAMVIAAVGWDFIANSLLNFCTALDELDHFVSHSLLHGLHFANVQVGGIHAYVLRDFHRAEMGAAHRAKVCGLGAFLR